MLIVTEPIHPSMEEQVGGFIAVRIIILITNLGFSAQTYKHKGPGYISRLLLKGLPGIFLKLWCKSAWECKGRMEYYTWHYLLPIEALGKLREYDFVEPVLLLKNSSVMIFCTLPSVCAVEFKQPLWGPVEFPGDSSLELPICLLPCFVMEGK